MTIKKVILVGMIVLLLESIGGYVYLTYRQPQTVSNNNPLILEPSAGPEQSLPSISARLALESSPSAIHKNDRFLVNTSINTSGHISAVDLTLKYDPSFLTLTATNSAQPFNASKLFPKTVFNSVDDKLGLATMSAVIEQGPTFSGDGLLTSIPLKAKRSGTTEITIVFTPGETRDTNVVSETKDILESVQNLSLTILP